MASYSILPYINPTFKVQDTITAAALYQASSNVFTTTNSFFNIQNGGFSNVAGALTVSGVSTLQAVNTQALTCSSLAISGVGSDAAAFTASSLNVSGATVLQGTLSVSGASTLAAVAAQSIASIGLVQAGSLAVTGATVFQGAVSCASTLNVAGASVLQALNCAQLTCTSEIDTGSLTCAAITASGAGIFNGGLDSGISTMVNFRNAGVAILGNLTLGQSQTALVNGTNVAINLNGFSRNFFTLLAVAGTNIGNFTITNGVVNAEFKILLLGGASAITLSKSLSTGGVTIYNNLSSNISIAAASRWLVSGVMVSSSVCYITFTNCT